MKGEEGTQELDTYKCHDEETWGPFGQRMIYVMIGSVQEITPFDAVLLAEQSVDLTGHKCWPGAVMLCEHITSSPLPAISVLELGAGPGMCGLVAARAMQAGTVLLTDGNEGVLSLLRAMLVYVQSGWQYSI